MASNPMQRKARNSFLLGMLVMLLIAGVIIAFLFMQLLGRINKEREEASSQVNVYVLDQDVSSGQVITNDMLTLQTVNRNLVPSNATSDLVVIDNFSLQDKEGNEIYTKYDDDGNGQLYITRNNNEYAVFKEEETENYYITNNNREDSNDKEYLELNSVPIIAKINMNANTVITTELISKSDNVVQDDVRTQEYNVVVLPIDLTTGDYIDIRVMFPNGQDFIIVSKKEVEIPVVSGVDSDDTIWVDLSEDEILHMSCAIVDAAQVSGAKIYATKYTDPGMQEAATPTYVVNESTAQLLLNDPNILESSINAINTRYAEGNSTNIRNNYIDSVISSQGDQAQSNLETNMEESITNSKTTRKEYLDSLAGAAAAASTNTTTTNTTTNTTSN